MKNKNVRNEIREFLIDSADEKFRDFSSSLCPNDDKDSFLGVRTPIIKKYAKNLLKKYQLQDLIGNIQNYYYEEILLEGLIISYSKVELDEKLKYVKQFVPKIINWAICDTFCASFKFSETEKEVVWDFINKYKDSPKEFEIRFYLIMMMDHFICDGYIDQVLENTDYIGNKKFEYYYVKMAIAWLISESYVEYKQKTEGYLKSNSLDNWTHNKAIQKIRESYRVSKEEKEKLKEMKRK